MSKEQNKVKTKFVKLEVIRLFNDANVPRKINVGETIPEWHLHIIRKGYHNITGLDCYLTIKEVKEDK